MKKWLEKIKSKSDIEKQSFAFWTSAIITFFIFAIWIFGTIYRFQNNQNEIKESSSSPFASITNIISNIFDGDMGNSQ